MSPRCDAALESAAFLGIFRAAQPECTELRAKALHVKWLQCIRFPKFYGISVFGVKIVIINIVIHC